MAMRQKPKLVSQVALALDLASSSVAPLAPRQSAGLLGTSASAQHSFLESTLTTRHPPAPTLWAHRFMAALSASSLLGSLTRAKIPPFFSTTTPQQEALVPQVALEAEPPKIASLIAVTGLSRRPGTN